MIPPNLILIWTGLNASIPSGWSRETSLDSKYTKGTANGVDPDVTGGSATHSHTSPTHTHTMVSHNHTGNTGVDTNQREDADNGDSIAQDNHYHAYNISGVSGGSLSNTVTYASVASDPSYYEVIFIKADGFCAIPDDVVTLFSKTTLPSNFLICDGTNGTPDLRNKYLKGASTGANAGGTGGTLNHEHAINHTHSGVTHTHSGTTGYASGGTVGGGSGTQVVTDHTHAITLDAASSETGSSYTGNAGSADTVEPAYKKLVAIQNTSGLLKRAEKGMVGMWLGTLDSIPNGWILCDGSDDTPDMRDKFLKVANSTGEISNTGGSNTHSHSASNSHTHTASGTHTHTGSTGSVSANKGTGVGGNGGVKPHTHPVTSASSANTSSWNNTTTSGDSTDGQPPYRTVAYIQYKFTVNAGVALLTNFI